LDTGNEDYWNCYAYDEGCESETVDAPGWYNCYWTTFDGEDCLGDPADEGTTTDDGSSYSFVDYLNCQQESGGYESADPEAACDFYDTP